MNLKFLGQLGIEVDTDDPLDRARAVASRGVIEALAGPRIDPADPARWADIIDRACRPGGFTPWRAPGDPSAPSAGRGAGLSARGLADAWREASPEGVRLAVEAGAGDPWHDRLSAAGRLAAGIVQAGTGVSSVIVPWEFAPGLASQWPIRIGVLPDAAARRLVARIREGELFRQRQATVSILGPGEDRFDLLVSPVSLDELPHRLAGVGLSVRARAIAAAGRMGTGLKSLGALSLLNAATGAGVFATGALIGGKEAAWANELVRSTLQGSAWDLALWDADRVARQDVGRLRARLLPPLTIVGDTASLLRFDLHPGPASFSINADLDAFEASLSRDFAAASPSLDTAFSLDDAEIPLPDLSLSDEADPLQAPAAAAAPFAPPPLHADPVFVEASTGRRVDDTREALRRDVEYLLKVALRRLRTGISHQVDAQPVAPLPSDSDIRLLVAISDPDRCFQLGETVQFIEVPAHLETGSTQEAVFAVTPVCDTPDEHRLATLEVRIYFEFNLIEHLRLSAEVVRRSAPSTRPRLGLPAPIFIEQSQQVGRSYEDIVRGLSPRQISIDVRQAGTALRLTFAVRTGKGATAREVVMQAACDVSLDQVAQELHGLRRLWQDVAVERFGGRPRISRPDFNRSLYELANAGDRLWSLLFRGVQDSSIWKVGEWLREHPAAPGSLVDVHLLDGTREFVFPWAMLYDRPLPRGLEPGIDPDGFWGLRYCVQLKAAGWHGATDATIAPPAGGARMDFMWWASFPNAAAQRDLLARFRTGSGGRLAVSEPIDEMPAFYRAMERSDADILYFYTHGYTKAPEVDPGADGLARIRQLYEALPEEDKAASELAAMVELLTKADFEQQDSWVALTYGRLELAAMRRAAMNLTRSPVVFLNMCQSAQVLPGLSGSFVSFFLERKARSVLGTECPMTTTFAHPFSAYLLAQFFAGQTLGEALRRARCHFMQQQNPLGLAYSLYGAANVRFDPPLVAGADAVPAGPLQAEPQPEGA